MPGPIRVTAILPKQQISSLYPPPRIRKWLIEVGEDFKKEMRVYPPVPPGSRYKRTFRYQRGWDRPLEITANRVTAINRVRYARYVGGPREQIREGVATQWELHAAHGWRSSSDIAPSVTARHLPRLRKLILPLR